MFIAAGVFVLFKWPRRITCSPPPCSLTLFFRFLLSFLFIHLTIPSFRPRFRSHHTFVVFQLAAFSPNPPVHGLHTQRSRGGQDGRLFTTQPTFNLSTHFPILSELSTDLILLSGSPLSSFRHHELRFRKKQSNGGENNFLRRRDSSRSRLWPLGGREGSYRMSSIWVAILSEMALAEVDC